MGFAVTGASSVAASDDKSVGYTAATHVGSSFRLGAAVIITGLSAGSNTFTAKYRALGGGTATYQDRQIAVMSLK